MSIKYQEQKMPLNIKYGVEVVVSNQWGSENINVFLVLAKKMSPTLNLLLSFCLWSSINLPSLSSAKSTAVEFERIIISLLTILILCSLYSELVILYSQDFKLLGNKLCADCH